MKVIMKNDKSMTFKTNREKGIGEEVKFLINREYHLYHRSKHFKSVVTIQIKKFFK